MVIHPLSKPGGEDQYYGSEDLWVGGSVGRWVSGSVVPWVGGSVVQLTVYLMDGEFVLQEFC